MIRMPAAVLAVPTRLNAEDELFFFTLSALHSYYVRFYYSQDEIVLGLSILNYVLKAVILFAPNLV